MKNRKKMIFKELMEKKKSYRNLISIPVSLLLHTSIIATLIIYPLLSSTNMPEVKMLSVNLLSMPKLITPGLQRGSKPGPKKKNRDIKKDSPKKINITSMSAPIDIPDEIPEPEFSITKEGNGDGVDGAIDDGFLDLWGDGSGTGDGDGFSGTMTMPVSIIKIPKLIKKVKPVYPSLALKARRQADVIVEAETDVYGKVNRVRIIKGDPFLNEAAVKAIKQWIYEPYIINGMPQAVKFTVKITFRLNRK